MTAESQELDDAVMRWLGEQNRVLLGEVAGLLDVEAGLAFIISGSSDTP